MQKVADINDFPGLLREARAQKGWTQEELAEYAQIKRSDISLYENNRKRPRVATINTLARTLGVDMVELLHRGVATNSRADEIRAFLFEAQNSTKQVCPERTHFSWDISASINLQLNTSDVRFLTLGLSAAASRHILFGNLVDILLEVAGSRPSLIIELAPLIASELTQANDVLPQPVGAELVGTLGLAIGSLDFYIKYEALLNMLGISAGSTLLLPLTWWGDSYYHTSERACVELSNILASQSFGNVRLHAASLLAARGKGTVDQLSQTYGLTIRKFITQLCEDSKPIS